MLNNTRIILCGTVEKESTNAYSKHLLLIWYPWAQTKSNKGRRIRGKRDIIKYSLRNLMGWWSVNLNYIEWDSHATTTPPSINPIFSKFDMYTNCVYKFKTVKNVTVWLPWNTLNIYLPYTFKWICNYITNICYYNLLISIDCYFSNAILWNSVWRSC